ncbi:MAG: bile acid:sodium symporter family protein [Marinomonas sp.]
MRGFLSKFSDPMIIMLLLATALANIVPAMGEQREAAQAIANIGVFVLFLVNGMRIKRSEIMRGFANWRFFLPLMIWVFGAMAIAGWGMSSVASLALDPKIALGFLFLGCLPSTIQSATSYTTLAGGNVALSVVGAALINIAGVFVTAPLFAVLGGGAIAELDSQVIIRIGTILILPFIIGQLVQAWTHDWVTQRKAKIIWLDRIVIAILVYVAFSGAIEQGLATMFTPATGAILFVLTGVFMLAANAAAWSVSGLLGFPRSDRIAFLFAGAQKSVAIGAPMAAILFTTEVAGFVIAPLLLYHLLQLILAAPLASHFADGQT